MNRRSFLLSTLAACAASRVPAVAPMKPTPRKKVLVLGGTGYIGPHIVRALLARGHTVTLFNRGKTHTELFPELEKLRGDRDGHLEALANRRWDAVIDPSGFVPRIVKLSADLLAPNVGQYIFMSSISVYKSFAVAGMDESAPVETLADPTNEDVKENYGALKALSEHAAERAMPGRVANIRAGLIIGPGDPTGRFTHWPSRLAQGGEVLAPGDGATTVQYIDVRDLAAWLARVVEDRTVGVYNTLGPKELITMKQVVDACNEAGGNQATVTWVDADFLEKNGVQGWSDMPLWLPPAGDFAAIGKMSNARAVAKGLTFRPILDTAKDTLAWLATVPEAERAKLASTGISRDREEKVLAAWKARG
jgi:2'-hydroxyisoflavone reductase